MARVIKQRLIPEDKDYSFCKICDSRGFLITQHTSPDGYVEPNEVQECITCDGTGKRKQDKD